MEIWECLLAWKEYKESADDTAAVREKTYGKRKRHDQPQSITKRPSAARRWAFLALFQAVLQEFIEVLVQFLLCRGQFLFSLFCPGFVIG